jgi:hypothetical protein
MYEHKVRPRDVCADDPACYERVRREIIEGKDLAPDPIAATEPNALWHRIDSLLAYLAHRRLRRVVVAGFSQASGHAALIAHDVEVARVIMLGGVQDRIHAGTPQQGPVDWIARWRDSKPATPGDRFYGFNHASDPTTRPIEWNASYDAMGVPAASCAFSEGGVPEGCHRITIPAADCGEHEDEAHATPVVRSLGSDGSPCTLDGPRWSTAATWRYLLTMP